MHWITGTCSSAPPPPSPSSPGARARTAPTGRYAPGDTLYDGRNLHTTTTNKLTTEETHNFLGDALNSRFFYYLSIWSVGTAGASSPPPPPAPPTVVVLGKPKALAAWAGLRVHLALPHILD
jgi:hypothetical protein